MLVLAHHALDDEENVEHNGERDHARKDIGDDEAILLVEMCILGHHEENQRQHVGCGDKNAGQILACFLIRPHRNQEEKQHPARAHGRVHLLRVVHRVVQDGFADRKHGFHSHISEERQMPLVLEDTVEESPALFKHTLAKIRFVLENDPSRVPYGPSDRDRKKHQRGHRRACDMDALVADDVLLCNKTPLATDLFAVQHRNRRIDDHKIHHRGPDRKALDKPVAVELLPLVNKLRVALAHPAQMEESGHGNKEEHGQTNNNRICHSCKIRNIVVDMSVARGPQERKVTREQVEELVHFLHRL
eukprot:comp22533_c0_seq1/m.56828 comp22533_c0_seq1/g.56828  ORF comp22533_c0_seq1/g.56828 comp22533_c0_seq1/m.56828 type:complete len:303 (-) comp22533_c0_seq1:2264-3172(-)